MKQGKRKIYKARVDDGFVYILSNLDLSIIMNCRVSKLKAIGFRRMLGFNQHDIALTKEYYYIDLYFTKHKLAIEVDKRGHKDRNQEKEKEKGRGKRKKI